MAEEDDIVRRLRSVDVRLCDEAAETSEGLRRVFADLLLVLSYEQMSLFKRLSDGEIDADDVQSEVDRILSAARDLDALADVLKRLDVQVDDDGSGLFAAGGWVDLSPPQRDSVRAALGRTPQDRREGRS